MPSIVYREFQPADIRSMARIRAAEWETEEYWDRRIHAYLAGELDPRFALKPRVSYVCCEDDSITGFIAGHLTTRHFCDGELEWINVIPERRERGIAAELLCMLARWFLAHKAIRICVDVEPSNLAARRFYKNRGAVNLNPHWLYWTDIRIALDSTKAVRRQGT